MYVELIELGHFLIFCFTDFVLKKEERGRRGGHTYTTETGQCVSSNIKCWIGTKPPKYNVRKIKKLKIEFFFFSIQIFFWGGGGGWRVSVNQINERKICSQFFLVYISVNLDSWLSTSVIFDNGLILSPISANLDS